MIDLVHHSMAPLEWSDALGRRGGIEAGDDGVAAGG